MPKFPEPEPNNKLSIVNKLLVPIATVVEAEISFFNLNCADADTEPDPIIL